MTLVNDMELMAGYARLGGGSTTYSPPGSLERINMVGDIENFHQMLSSLAALKERRHQRKGAPDVAEEYY